MVRPMVKIDSKQIRRATALGMIEELNAKNVNRNQIAREAKISYQQIDNWIKGKHAPGVRYLKRLEKLHRRYCDV